MSSDDWLDELAAFDECGYRLVALPGDTDEIDDMIGAWKFTPS